MGLTLNDTLNFCQPFIEYSPLNAGTNFEPSITIGSMVRNTILNAPFIWPWNRNEYSSVVLASGTQDYTFPVTDFAYLEKVSLLSADGTYGFEIKDCYNTNILGIDGTAAVLAQPNAASVKFYAPGTNVAIRFLSIPDQAYTGSLTYQKLALPFQVFTLSAAGNAGNASGSTTYTGMFNTASFTVGQTAQIAGFTNAGNNGSFTIVSVTGTQLVVLNAGGIAESSAATAVNISWFPIPDSFSDIFNNLYLAETMSVVDDGREQIYRQRGIAALLSKASGLTEMDRNAFLAQWIARGSSQQTVAQARANQGVQARGI